MENTPNPHHNNMDEVIMHLRSYDQKTFSGRFLHFLNVIDPRTLFTSDKVLQQSVKLVEDFHNGEVPSGVTSDDVWQAQKIKQAILHPDTGEKIPMPFRMSGFVPFGTPIIVGLLLPGQSLLSSAFWQWLNQSHNACVNYCNRNASQATTNKDILLGYTGAVTSAVGIALGLNVLLKKTNKVSPAVRNLMQRFIPFPAVAVASVCNVVLMRHAELYNGIEVTNAQGDVIGVSQIAAKKALKETALTRAFLPAPILIIPPILMSILEKTSLFRKYPKVNLPAQFLFTTVSFAFALPLAIALFPQFSQISIEQVELELQSKTSERFLYYNKGL